MTILDKITAHKRKEVALRKEQLPISELERLPLFERDTISLASAIRNSSTGIIAEHKRKSPSKSVINDSIDLPSVVEGYESAGASGISVLTDSHFFGGSLDDLSEARKLVETPLLRKDFMVDPYQFYEAKAHGADAILLIAACLSHRELKDLSTLAKNLGMDVLLEVHNKQELDRSLLPSVDILGVNNRNLKTFDVSIETSKELSSHIPTEFVKISESGISKTETIEILRTYGYQGFLMGENFMKESNPGFAAAQFINQLS